jgi:hypothetical protein
MPDRTQRYQDIKRGFRDDSSLARSEFFARTSIDLYHILTPVPVVSLPPLRSYRVMKTDLHTKLVLTVIAVCLIGQLFRNVPVVTTARADSGKQLIQSVSVVGWSAGTL